MQRIQDPTAVTTLPAPPTLTGQPVGFFQGSIAGRDRHPHPLLVAEHDSGGAHRSAGERRTAAGRVRLPVTGAAQIIGARSAPFLASGNFTVPAGVTTLKRVRVWGAGASGGTGTGAYPGGGGGGGGYAEYIGIGVTPGQIIPVVVGLRRGRRSWRQLVVRGRCAPQTVASRAGTAPPATSARPARAARPQAATRRTSRAAPDRPASTSAAGGGVIGRHRRHKWFGRLADLCLRLLHERLRCKPGRVSGRRSFRLHGCEQGRREWLCGCRVLAVDPASAVFR